MKINIIGGGPAGLYLAILVKKADPGREVTVLERDGPSDTFGWGIVFSDKTMDYLEDNDAETHGEIQESFVIWGNVDIVYRDQRITVGGNKFSGIGRLPFLNIMHHRCQELGVDMRFHTNVTDVDEWRDCDLLVGADGASSLVRETYGAHFGSAVDVGKNTFVWLGTQQPFDALTLTVRENEAGIFLAHSYRFSPTTSTFIVECVGDAWKNAGFESMSADQARAYLEKVFAPDLRGHPLLTNDFFRWRQFPIVSSERWSYENVVLLGDALHTAHFSIGSGTKLALEDAIALAKSLSVNREVSASLQAFQRERQPVKERYLNAARESLVWIENIGEKMHLEPIPFAYEIMTRSKKVDHDNLRQRDAAFVERYENWRRAHVD